MIWELKEFNYSEAHKVPEWLMERPGAIKFPPSMTVIRKPPNIIRILVVVGYEEAGAYYQWMAPVEAVASEGTAGAP